MATSLAFLSGWTRRRSSRPAPGSTRTPAELWRLAIEAVEDEQWEAAENYWRQIYERDRGNREALLGLVSTLQKLDRIDDAEITLREADPDHAAYADYAIIFALLAQLRFDLPTAVERSLRVVERFPELAYGYTSSAVLLTAAGREDEALELLTQGLVRFPRDNAFILPSIRVAVARHDWRTAVSMLDRFDEWTSADPSERREVDSLRDVITAGQTDILREQAMEAERRRDFRLGLEAWRSHASLAGQGRDNLLGLARCHRETGSFGQAESELSEAASLFGHDAEIDANMAQIASVAGDWQQAARRWTDVLRQYSDVAGFVGPAATALAHAGRIEEAEVIVDEALSCQPQSIDLRVTKALIAEIGGNWESAIDQWTKVIECAPNNPGFELLRREAAKHLVAADGFADRESRQTPLLLDEESSLPPTEELVKQFESLGDNCEFGVVQRHFGAEPITLFRFAAVEPEQMIRLLELDLEPLGDPAHTHVYEMLDEYYIRDDRGFYYMHTFVKTGQVDRDRYVKQQIPRINYLKRNFLNDIREAGRIYVCKHSTSQISDETLHRLSRCLRNYGDNILLGGRRADDAHPAGTAVQLSDHIFVGYTTQLHGEEDRPENSKSWELVLKKVYQARERRTAVRAQASA